MELKQINYTVYSIYPNKQTESIFAAKDFNQNQPSEYRAVPIYSNGQAGAVFANKDLGIYTTIPIHPDL